ncbi:MAG: rod shape-determining protein MreD [Bacteroidetes bacterium]|nr:rod shape-determining protein MreD [Bacteroidota bacterium]
MRTKFILSILFFIPVLFVQITLVQFITWGAITPNFILILLVFYSIFHGQLYGTVLGFVYGLLFDLITGGLLGSAMLSYTLAGFIAGYFSNKNKRHIYLKPFSYGFIVLLCSITASIIYSIFSTIDFSTNIITSLFEEGLLPGLYTSVVAIIIIYFYPRRKLLES